MKNWLGKFKCLNCNHEWEEYSGSAECPECKNNQVKWLNYEELYNKHFSNRR